LNGKGAKGQIQRKRKASALEGLTQALKRLYGKE